jgi:polyisoprenoid-binding protein YceI
MVERLGMGISLARNSRTIGASLVLLLLIAPASRAATFKVDPEHTTVLFNVRHMFTTVTGRFEKFQGKIVYDENDPTKTQVEGTIEAATINTNVVKRDADLRSAHFFDVAKYPNITFKTTGIADVDQDKKRAKMSGVLAMHGVEKPIVLDVQFLGRGKDPWGNERAGFHAATTINRKDWGLNWNEVLETGGFLVGDDVTIEINAEGLVE